EVAPTELRADHSTGIYRQVAPSGANKAKVLSCRALLVHHYHHLIGGIIWFMKNVIKLIAVSIAMLGAVNSARAQQTPPTRPPDPAAVRQAPATTFKAPDNLDFRTANIISEGVRLQAELFSLKSLAGKPLPT